LLRRLPAARRLDLVRPGSAPAGRSDPLGRGRGGNGLERLHGRRDLFGGAGRARGRRGGRGRFGGADGFARGREVVGGTRPGTKRPTEEDELERGSLGIASIVFTVLAAAAPIAVIVAVVPLGIALGVGGGLPGMFVVCGALLALFAVGYTAMSTHVVNAG